jgi:hypothetical protein
VLEDCPNNDPPVVPVAVDQFIDIFYAARISTLAAAPEGEWRRGTSWL